MVTRIHFLTLAAAAFYSLTEEEQKKSNELIELVATDMKHPSLSDKLRPMPKLGSHIYSLKLNTNLRMIFERTKSSIEILDIFNVGLKQVYSGVQ